uniref:uncharacterized protein LOC120834317 isoform X1 n=1 Tax=Gasterosteus aculeatus aculeatus TaxID=481459 RepID=UPI001A99BCBD|nr:uncharacterized protein LOC120834317 isoform X1 [Gasterosteus aculeatus aculeatus]XP_040058186.1 uncharacterized protein LOC120834317 isoform X1 [Gasterosteus aculeatus aculeatus]
MVIMFHLNQAALLSITLFMMCQVSADSNAVEQRNISVYRGESVTFTCNVSKTKVSQIQWTKGELSFVFEVSSNTTVSNLTSHRLTIDTNFPSKMNILNVQHNDTGIYRCTLYEEKRTRSLEWNLTVSEEHEEFSYLWLYITTATGSLLSFFITAVCLYRKIRARKSNQSHNQFPHHSAGEVRRTLSSSFLSCLCYGVELSFFTSFLLRRPSIHRRPAQPVEPTTSGGVSTQRGSIQSMGSTELTTHFNER